MKFRKNDRKTRQIARRGGAATAAKWAAIHRAREREARRPAEEEAYAEFIAADSGTFDGFRMVDVFHEHHNKADAVIVDEADDCATCRGVHVGADGITCYFFAQPEQVKKIVTFNRSAYLF